LNRFCSVFSQILKVFPSCEFQQLVARHDAERGAKGFSCWTQLVSMLFCQLGRMQSLREISNGLRACEGKLKHLGIRYPAKSTLAYANRHRPWELFRDLFELLLARCQQVAPKHGFRFKNKLYSLDATTIALCASMFDWARYKQTKGGVKLHVVLDHDGYLPTFAWIREAKVYDVEVARALELPADSIVVFDRAYNDFQWFYSLTRRRIFFVTRMKDGTRFDVLAERQPPARSRVLADQTIRLCKEFKGVESEQLRRIAVEAEDGTALVFTTNNFALSAKTIGDIYKSRWEIEKFFRILKQNLKIKTFVGTSENALHIQIWTALIAVLLLRYLMFRSRYGWSFSNFVAIVRQLLFVHRDLEAWLRSPFNSDPPSQPPQLAFVWDS
jgi:hypothetical protein